jgi:hypothetical protein
MYVQVVSQPAVLALVTITFKNYKAERLVLLKR